MLSSFSKSCPDRIYFKTTEEHYALYLFVQILKRILTSWVIRDVIIGAVICPKAFIVKASPDRDEANLPT